MSVSSENSKPGNRGVTIRYIARNHTSLILFLLNLSSLQLFKWITGNSFSGQPFVSAAHIVSNTANPDQDFILDDSKDVDFDAFDSAKEADEEDEDIDEESNSEKNQEVSFFLLEIFLILFFSLAKIEWWHLRG